MLLALVFCKDYRENKKARHTGQTHTHGFPSHRVVSLYLYLYLNPYLYVPWTIRTFSSLSFSLSKLVFYPLNTLFLVCLALFSKGYVSFLRFLSKFLPLSWSVGSIFNFELPLLQTDSFEEMGCTNLESHLFIMSVMIFTATFCAGDTDPLDGIVHGSHFRVLFLIL